MEADADLEKIIFCCPELNRQEIETLSCVDDRHFAAMETAYASDSSSTVVYPFVSIDQKKGEPFVEIYIWDYMLFSPKYVRFILKDGYALPDKEQSLYLKYTKEEDLIIHEEDCDEFYAEINKYFPKWNFPRYAAENIGDALEYLYYVSHRGYKEILYKAGLLNIAENIEKIPEFNVIGTSPTQIIGHGVSMKLLRILDNPELLSKLYYEQTIEHCVDVYKEFAGYMGAELPSVIQWEYLEALYDNNGIFWGGKFNRTIYRRLHNLSNYIHFELYNRFFELKKELPEMYKGKIPRAEELMSVITRMEKILYCSSRKAKMDPLIKRRKNYENQYEYIGNQYMVILPGNSMDICLEAVEQGSCLLDYLEEHACRETTILFVRRTDKKQHSFVTMEISNEGVIKQVLAKYNYLPQRAVYEFLEEYACRKEFNYDPERLITDSLGESEDAAIDEDLLDYLEKHRKKLGF